MPQFWCTVHPIDGQCFAGVKRLGIRGYKYGKLSGQKLSVLNPSSLTHLYITNAGIIELDNKTFEAFFRLQSLNLDNNLLTHIPRHWYTVVHSPFQLHKLSISKNHISSLDPGCFETLTGLDTLDLRHNLLREVHSHWLVGMNNLRTLLLSGNRIQTILPHTFDSLKRLQHLDFSNNELVCLRKETFLTPKKLFRVVLGGNKILASKSDTVHRMPWHVVLESCGLLDIHVEQDNHQWIRLEANSMVLHIIYEPSTDLFSIDWFNTLAYKSKVPINLDSCNPLSKMYRLGHFRAYPPFVVVVKNSEASADTSPLTQCSESWEESGSISFTLKGASNLQIYGINTSSKLRATSAKVKAFSIVATTTKNRTTTDSQSAGKADDPGRNLDTSRVACFSITHDEMQTPYFFNASVPKQEKS
ncbi:PREDICTED: leucine-rich repeat-containing protein 15-like [Branchiostoma belcheri]|uniref:Leucine-rich repeat-containing protein 15-like n=1 Tax=Branchiostoma belcheri TaxID=7741 RepID=A0A6P5A350_BRABE|nr:PREDICTED: leucine-rich repeat-containing protein 15-like [Branchiostoma belcheri]